MLWLLESQRELNVRRRGQERKAKKRGVQQSRQLWRGDWRVFWPLLQSLQIQNTSNLTQSLTEEQTKLDVSTALGCYSDFRRRESDSHYNTDEP